MAIFIVWYIIVLCVSVFSIPFSLACFNVGQLLSVWPFAFAFLVSLCIAAVGFCVPAYWLTKGRGEDSAEKL